MIRIKLAPLSRHLRTSWKPNVRTGKRTKPGSGVGHGMSVTAAQLHEYRKASK